MVYLRKNIGSKYIASGIEMKMFLRKIPLYIDDGHREENPSLIKLIYTSRMSNG